MALFGRRQQQPSSGEFAPDETPLGPRTYPRLGNEPRGMASSRPGGPKRGSWFSRIDWQEIWRTKKWWIIGGGVLLVLLIVGVVSLVGRSHQGSLTDQVHLTVTGPASVTLGSDVVYDVQVSNDSGTTLTNTQLIVIYPEGFSFTSAEPAATNPQGTEFAPNDISGGKGYSLRINGRLTGGVQTEQLFIARLTFSPGDSPERLQIESTATTTIGTAAFTFNVDGPETSLPSNPVTFDVELQNNQQQPLEQLQVRATYAGGFEFQKSTPTPTDESNVWTFTTLGVGQQQKISLTGVLGGSPDEVKRFVFAAGVVDKDGNFLKQAEVEKIVKLTTPSVTVTQTVNAATELAADQDTELSYVVTFENTGPAGLTNLVLEVGFTPGVWDTKRLNINNGGVLKSGNLIRWDGVTVPALRALEAGAKAQVTFKVKPLQQLTVDSADDKNFATTATPTIKIGSASVNGNPTTVKYKASVAAGATSTVVAGPNPPVVGQQTTYEVTWTLSNLYNELSGARFVGSVPAGADFVAASGHVSVGEDLVFNAATKQILWNIGKVPANVGKLTPDFRATFRITVTPQANQTGQKETLVTQQEFTAHDTWTNEDRKVTVPDVLSAAVQ